MLLYLCLAGITLFVLGVFLWKVENPGEMIFLGVGFISCGYIIFGAIAVDTTDDEVVETYKMDSDTVYNEVYNGVDHYYIESGGDKIILKTDDDDKFIISEENTVEKKCDYLPDWILPFDLGSCYWVIRAENVE